MAEAWGEHPAVPAPPELLCTPEPSFKRIQHWKIHHLPKKLLPHLIIVQLIVYTPYNGICISNTVCNFPLCSTVLHHACRAQTTVLFEKTHTYTKQKFVVFFFPLYLQNITNVLCPVSMGSSNIHINNYRPFPGASIEKQHRKMLLIKQLVS